MSEFSTSAAPSVPSQPVRSYDPQDPPRFGEWVRVLGVTPAPPRADSPTVPGDNRLGLSFQDASREAAKAPVPGDSERPTDPSGVSRYDLSVETRAEPAPAMSLEENAVQFHADELSDVSWKLQTTPQGELQGELQGNQHEAQSKAENDEYQENDVTGETRRSKQRKKQRDFLLVFAVIALSAVVAGLWALQRSQDSAKPITKPKPAGASGNKQQVAPAKAADKATSSATQLKRSALKANSTNQASSKTLPAIPLPMKTLSVKTPLPAIPRPEAP